MSTVLTVQPPQMETRCTFMNRSPPPPPTFACDGTLCVTCSVRLCHAMLRYESQPYILHLLAADMPPLGALTFTIEPDLSVGASTPCPVAVPESGSGSVVDVSNEFHTLTFNTTSGLLQRIVTDGETTEVTQEVLMCVCAKPCVE